MSLNAATIRLLAEKGLSALDIAEVAESLDVRKDPGAADRQARRRARLKAEEEAEQVTRDVTRDDVRDESPSPDKAPQTPKINPTPHGCEAPAREPAHEGPIPGQLLPFAWLLTLARWHGALIAARTTALNALWHGTPPPPGVTDDCWSGFLAHRKAMPKAGKFTPRAYELLCEKLAKLATDEWPPGALLDQAIDRNWITVFPPKDARNDNQPARHHQRQRPGRFRDPLLNVDERLGRTV